jgi:hypothetical protein
VWWLAVLPARGGVKHREVGAAAAALVLEAHPRADVRCGSTGVPARFAISEASARGDAAPPLEVLQLMEDVARTPR